MSQETWSSPYEREQTTMNSLAKEKAEKLFKKEPFNPAFQPPPPLPVKVLPALPVVTRSTGIEIEQPAKKVTYTPKKGDKRVRNIEKADMVLVENIRNELGMSRTEFSAAIGYAEKYYYQVLSNKNMSKIVEIAAKGLLAQWELKRTKEIIKAPAAPVTVPVEPTLVHTAPKSFVVLFDCDGNPTAKSLKECGEITVNGKKYILIEA